MFRASHGTVNIAEFAPSLRPVPLPPTCPEPKPLHPPPQANPSLTPFLDLLLFGIGCFKEEQVQKGSGKGWLGGRERGGRGTGACEICSVPWVRAPTTDQSPCTPDLFGTATKPSTLSCNQGPWSTPVGTPPTPQGILQKTPFFFFFRNNKNTTHVAKFAPSMGPVSLPPTPPEPKPLHPPPSPCPAS